MINTLLNFALIGITAWVFTNILILPEMIFGKYAELLGKLPSYLAKPLGLCEYCFAGQLSFWYYIFSCHSYDLISHIIVVSFTIFITELINILKYGRA